MIDVKAAVRIANEYIEEMYTAEQTPQLALDEVELSDDEQYWLVTMSFSKASGATPIEAMTGQLGIPVSKVFKIRAENGQVVSMTNLRD